MSLLVYSHALVAGTPENVNDVQDMFNDVKNVMNGNLDASNLAATAKPATLMGAYRVVSEVTGFVAGGTPAGPTGASATDGPSPVVPADFVVAGLTTQFRLRVLTGINATAPGVDLTFGLYPVTGFSGGSGVVGPDFGSVLAGSTVTRSAPSALASLVDASADFTIATPGGYRVLVSLSGTSIAASRVEFVAQIQVRNV